MQKLQKTEPRTDVAISARCQAVKTLTAVLNGTSLASVLHKNLDVLAPNDRGFCHELVLGTLRHWFAFLRLSENLAHNPITDKTTLAALHMGMYQLFYLRTPDHAAIGETITALKQAGSPETAGLVNALLRRCQKDFSKLSKKVFKNHSLPNWLAKQIKVDWREHYTELTSNLRESAPIFLRVNPRHLSTAEYAELLAKQEIQYTLVDNVIRLDSKLTIEKLPYFEEGYVSIQDVHAQQAVQLFDDLTNKHVLDACAAPGGKTAQLLENFDIASLTAVDIDSYRTLRIADTLSRLGLLTDKVQLLTEDMGNGNITDMIAQNSYMDANKFDAILLDAPCTATGVIRRHPDICLLRQEADVQKTVMLQQQILANAWKMLKQGGELVYVTCSLLKVENSQQIGKFLAVTADAKEVKLALPNAISMQYGYQYLPLSSVSLQVNQNSFMGDGFYIAKLKKHA